jgi:hypothetical protein
MNRTLTEVFHRAADSSWSWAVNIMWTLCNRATNFGQGVVYAGDAPSPGPISNMKSWPETE